MKRKLELTFVLLLMIGALIFSRRLSKMIAQEASGKIDSVDVIIDAGHGGTDPGKVGINQALEKDINLEIAKKLEKLSGEEYQNEAAKAIAEGIEQCISLVKR